MKKVLFLTAVLALALVGTVFGQKTKRKIGKKTTQVSVFGVGGGVDDNRRMRKNSRKRKYSPKIRQAQDVFVTERRAKPKRTNMFLDGGNDSWNTRKKTSKKKKALRKVSSTRRKSNLRPRVGHINDQTPADWNERHRRKSTKPGVWGDPHVNERRGKTKRKVKKTQSLLPYVEQGNLRKRNK